MAFEQLYNDLFPSGGNDSARKMTEQYPWFSPGHFFALKQTQPGDDAFANLAAKAALHFGDPLLLHFQLHKPAQHAMQVSAAKEAHVEASAEEQVYEATAPQPIDNPYFETSQPVAEPAVVEDKVAETAVPDLQEKDTTPHSPEGASLAENKPIVNEPALFEPLHTTDYFASQGIKLSEVVQTGDKMGRQLRSFTEWLKTMKKVHPEGLNEKTAVSSPIDNTVQTIAELSNKEEEVITESMAVVFIQQGKLNKAREIYKKLSLLNPSKSAYFAAKLNEIQ